MVRSSIIALAVCAAGTAHAGGVFVPGTGPQAQPRAGAFVAKADDPSAIYHNPAGLARQTGTVVHVGVNLIDFSQRFRRLGSYEESGEPTEPSYQGDRYPEVEDASSPSVGIGGFQALPLIAVSTDFGLALPLRFGLGLMAPNGYPQRDYVPGYTFEDPDTGPPPQRYDVMDQDVFAVFPSIAVAYTPTPKLDIGLRLSHGAAGLKGRAAVWGIRNYGEYVGNDGVIAIDTSDNFVAGRINAFGSHIPTLLFGVGALYRPLANVELGASYRSAAHVEAKGTARAVLGAGLGLPGQPESLVPSDFPECEDGGTAAALKACLDFELPQTFAVGGRWIVRDANGSERGDIELDAEWEDWSNSRDFGVIVDGQSTLTGLRFNPSVIRHGFRDVLSLRLGGSYAVPFGGIGLEFRGGAAYDTAAAPETWTRLDIDGLARVTLGLGVALRMSRFRIDLGGGAVLEQVRVVDGGCNPDVGNAGCDGSNDDTAVADRTSPDPVQPLQDDNNQIQSPFNDGRYDQGYLLFSAGVTTWF